MWPAPRRLGIAVGLTAAVVGALTLGPAAVVPAGLAAGETARRFARARLDRAAAELRAELPGFCTAMAAELQAGQAPAFALAVAGEAAGPRLTEVLAPVTAVAALVGDVAASLRAAADRPGADALRLLAACWTVTGDVGAGLATALGRLGEGLRALARLQAEVTAQLAGARATARLLAVLPAFGLLLGQAIGAAPTHFLLHTPTGAACAALTTVLDVLGLAWTDRIAAHVQLST